MLLVYPLHDRLPHGEGNIANTYMFITLFVFLFFLQCTIPFYLKQYECNSLTMLQQYEKVIISTVDCFKMYVHFSVFPFSSFAIRCHERTIDHCTVAFHFCDSVWSLLMKTKMFSLLIYICIVVWGAIDQFNNATYAQCLDLDFERIISWSCLFRSFE